ncbi:unnamed protein product [Alopecurus aequalis]
MARKKVSLRYISNKSTRRKTLKNRSRGLMKKAGDLSILCDSKACVIIYGEGESVPQVFPSHSEAMEILNRFKNMPDLKQFKKIMDQESFLLQRIGKLRGQVSKAERDYEELEIRSLLHKVMSGNLQDLEVLSAEELTYVGWTADVVLKSISDRILKINGQAPVYQPSAVQASTLNVPDDMNIIGPAKICVAQSPFQHNEGFLDMVSSGGGDIGPLVYNGFNGGQNGENSMAGFKDDKMIEPFDLGNGPNCPWGDTYPRLSSTSFPPM